jgi:hypothetical protein
MTIMIQFSRGCTHFISILQRELDKVGQGAESLQCNIQKFQYLHNSRWVASKVGALSARERLEMSQCI